MRIDLAKVEASIRKLEEVRRLASDPEMMELLETLLVDGSTTPATPPTERVVPPVNGSHNDARKRKGDLTRAVKEHIAKIEGRFTGYELVDRMLASAYTFNTKTPALAVNDVLRAMIRRGELQVQREGKGSVPNSYEKVLP